ncbi:hypothetical protein [Algoriphagus sp.]|uniref:hypothetical protein n=1 Tax=Algoriphagus sp. TaxID=1872435 RepID=UPI0025D28D93|nr:hypothetical protein [Algoriphagus sp.]
MKRLFLALVSSILFLSSCTKDDPTLCCTVVDIGLDLTISDALGNDLLDRNNPKAFKEEHIRLFYMENGEKVEKVHTASRNFFIFKDEQNDQFVIRVFLGGDYPIGETIIEWNHNESDSFLTEIEKFDNGSLILRKVWYENDLVYDTGTSTGRAFIELKK